MEAHDVVPPQGSAVSGQGTEELRTWRWTWRLGRVVAVDVAVAVLDGPPDPPPTPRPMFLPPTPGGDG